MDEKEKRPAGPGEEVDRLRRLLTADLYECPLRLTYQEDPHQKSDKACCK